MAEERAQRRLAAVLAADVVGYSRLMEQDESDTMAALKARREKVLKPLVARYQGRIFKFTGDGVLAEFGSAVNAVQCAIDLQHGMAAANTDLPEARRIVLRIGVNLGDIMVEGGDLYGDGVNVAARLENMTDPGGICVSRSIYEQVKNKLAIGFDELGPQAVKNIAEPVYVYRVRNERQDEPARKPLPLPDKPSIAVLPFTCMGNDPEQEAFADGLAEDLITDLSHKAGLFVIARNSTFAYKGKAVDVRTIARDLGVRYLLEGSARRAAGRVRINVQLIDAIGGGHLWAERFDRSLDDVFAVQDEATAKIVEALVGRLTASPARNRPKNIESYDLCVRARLLMQSPQAAREARVLLERAISLDPDFAEARRWLAIHLMDAWTLWGEPMVPNRRIAVEMAEKAVALDANDAGCHLVLGYVLFYERRWQESEREFAVAIKLDPNSADAWAHLSDATLQSGRPAEAIEQAQRALRLDPHAPGWYYWILGQAQYGARQYTGAVETLQREETYRTGSRRILAASLAQLGKKQEAHQEAELFMLSNPRFTISHWAATQAFRDEAMREHFVEGYRKAGLAE